LIANVHSTLDSKKEWQYPQAQCRTGSILHRSETKTFALEMMYRSTTFYYDYCSLETTVKELLQNVLKTCAEKGEGSWLNTDIGCYVLHLSDAFEYIFPEQYSCSLLDFAFIRESALRHEVVRFQLIEKTQLATDAIDSTLRSHPDQSIFHPPKGCTYTEVKEEEETKIDVPLRFTISNCPFTQENGEWTCRIRHGETSLEECFVVREEPSENLEFVFEKSMSHLPREVYVSLEYRKSPEGFFQTLWGALNTVEVWYTQFPIFDFQGECSSFPFKIEWTTLVPEKRYHPRWMHANSQQSSTIRFCGFKTYHYYSSFVEEEQRFVTKDWTSILKGEASDVLLWRYRHFFATKAPERLMDVLKSAPQSQFKTEKALYRLLEHYPPLSPFTGLEVLAKYPESYFIRCYAVECLKGLSNEELRLCMPQLIQCLKLEMYFSSPLCVFLLTRGLQDLSIGHAFYWHLSSELEDVYCFGLFDALKRCYLETLKTEYRKHLLSTERYFERLLTVASIAQQGAHLQRIHNYLRELDFPKKGLRLPTCYKRKVSRLLVEECFVLQSKTKPLWLTFQTKNGTKVFLILKIGDDARVDQLALQLMVLLDMFWKQNHLDLRMRPYVVLPLRSKVGLIQVSAKANTLSTINWNYGGNNLASAFSTTSIKAYLHTSNTPTSRHYVFRNFALSCSGYCVFTYIFGIGDRHSDNILCTESGNLFHIDFGYFLGQRSTFLGFSRESNFVVLTPNYIQAMDCHFSLFLKSACKAYAIAQEHRDTFQTFITLINYGQMLNETQGQYLSRSLPTFESQENAKKHFNEVLVKSVQDKRSLVNDFAHLIATRTAQT
jgi:hypothetical protein